uniref:Uncharacterized protein n=1 Tax=Arundo donax TaxID=35708 RepID=A0A0A9FLG0_ARUDO
MIQEAHKSTPALKKALVLVEKSNDMQSKTRSKSSKESLSEHDSLLSTLFKPCLATRLSDLSKFRDIEMDAFFSMHTLKITQHLLSNAGSKGCGIFLLFSGKFKIDCTQLPTNNTSRDS